MCRLNAVGTRLGRLPGVTAMTDVTGFALMGHLLEMCEGSGIEGELDFASVPVLAPVADYVAMGCVPGGTARNFASYGHKLGAMDALQQSVLCDPQTSGGLLVAVRPEAPAELETVLADAGIAPHRIGRLLPRSDGPWVRLR